MSYIKVDQDDVFELYKQAVIYKSVSTQGLIYNKKNNACLGHSADFYYDRYGNAPDLSVYETRFPNGKIRQIGE